jgi:hypothetical protein
MNLDTEHECIAVHCTTCCPSHQAYSRGWEDGKSWNTGMTKLDVINGTIDPVMLIAVLIGLLIVAKVVKDAKHDRRAVSA